MAERQPARDEDQARGPISVYLRRAIDGDGDAVNRLIDHSADRLQRLTRRMLQLYPTVQRWAQTDDVLQNALMRLVRAMKDVKPTNARSFFGLATLQIRRELIDLARHLTGPMGVGANHASHAGNENVKFDAPDITREPSRLEEWSEFHQQVEQLDEELREVVDLLFYQGLSQAEAADLMGVTVRTVQRRWQSALVTLHRLLKSGPEG